MPVEPVTDVRELAIPSGLIDQYRARFPWYGRLIETLGVGPDDALADLPIIGQEVLAEHYYLDAEQPEGTHAFLTSGTSGGPRKRILYGADDDDAYVAQRYELFGRFTAGIDRGAVAVADLGTGHAAATAHRTFELLGFDARDIDFRAPLSEHIARLNDWQPTVLFTMPMILDKLMQSPDELRITPRKIAVVGDVAPAAWRANVAKHFGVQPADVLDVFGSIEIGAIGFSCSETGLYHFHDHIVPEVLDSSSLLSGDPERARAVGDGALLLTSTTRPNFPALRYVTGDAITGLQYIEFEGKRVAAFERIDGRIGGGDLKHGERVSGHDLCQAIAQVFPGHPFEVSNDDGITIRIVADHITHDKAAALRAAIAASSPDVATMIESGLVGAIGVEAITTEELQSGNAKRRFNLKRI